MRGADWSHRGGTPRFQSDIPSQQVEQPRSSEAVQPDIVNFGKYRQLLRDRPVRHLGEQSWAPIDDSGIHKVRMANRSQRIVVANTPQKIMQQSMNRTQFVIGNNTGVVVLWNFGSPSLPGAGIPIQINGKDGRAGYSCPVDEIWVTCSIAGAIVTAYESVSVFP